MLLPVAVRLANPRRSQRRVCDRLTYAKVIRPRSLHRIALVVRALGLTVFVALAGLGTIACGGGDGNSSGDRTVTVTQSSGGKPPSKQEYIRQADAVCESFQTQGKKIEREANQARNFKDLERIGDEGEQLLNTFATKLSALEKPRDAAGANEFISAVNQLEGLYRELYLSAQDRDLAQIRHDTQRLRELVARLQGVAVAYGFRVCGKG